MNVRIDVLRAALNALLTHAEERQGKSVEVDDDLYWFVPKELLSKPETEPTGLTLGSLVDDWSQVAEIGTGAKEPFGYALVWASTVLRAIGDRTP